MVEATLQKELAGYRKDQSVDNSQSVKMELWWERQSVGLQLWVF